jgi:hypothetical protein
MGKKIAYDEARKLVEQKVFSEEGFALLLNNGQIGAPTIEPAACQVVDSKGDVYDFVYTFKRAEGGRARIGYNAPVVNLINAVEAMKADWLETNATTTKATK